LGVNDQSSSAGCPARFSPGLAVTPAFSGSALYGAGRYPASTVSMGPSLAQGRVDPMRVLVMASLGQDSALSVGWWCLAAHGPTSCFSPTRRGALADLSRCKPARHCCQLRACMATGYRSNWDHIGCLGCGP